MSKHQKIIDGSLPPFNIFILTWHFIHDKQVQQQPIVHRKSRIQLQVELCIFKSVILTIFFVDRSVMKAKQSRLDKVPTLPDVSGKILFYDFW